MSTIEVRIMRLAHGNDLPLPSYQSAHAAGLDLLAAVPADAPATIVPGGSAIAIPVGTKARAPGARLSGASAGTAANRSRPAASAL